VVSEELDELFELSDRLHVIARGRLSPAVPIGDASVAKIGAWMSGLWHEEVQEHLASLASTDQSGGQYA
jgi:ABC-type sugar transport system ATPase subunit